MNAFDRALRGGRNEWRLHALSVFSVAVAFVCLVATLLAVTNINRVEERWDKVGRISVFLRATAESREVGEIEKALRATAGISQVRYVSSEAARRELLREDADETLLALPDQAFPASLELETSDSLSKEQKEQLHQQLASLPAVETVETYEAWADRLSAVLMGVVTAAGLLAFVVLLAVVSVVGSTMRLSLQRRHVEIEVLKLVGATDKYVRGPFLVEGAAEGAIGAALAIAFVAVLYLIVRAPMGDQVSVLLGVSPSFLNWYHCLGLVGLGSILGALAAQLSLRKMLSV
jgi:cell division transport system permease protein